MTELLSSKGKILLRMSREGQAGLDSFTRLTGQACRVHTSNCEALLRKREFAVERIGDIYIYMLAFHKEIYFSMSRKNRIARGSSSAKSNQHTRTI